MRNSLENLGSTSSSDLYWLTVHPGGSGVYVYIEQGVIRYAGKTNNLIRRLNEHHSLDRKLLRRVARGSSDRGLYFYPCPDPLMSYLEAFVIYTFRPSKNIVYPTITYNEAFHDLCMDALHELKGLCHDHNV